MNPNPCQGSKPWSAYNSNTRNYHQDETPLHSLLPKPRFNWNPRTADFKRKPARTLTAGLQEPQNRFRHRRFFHPRKFRAPLAPRNTTSFIIRAKRSGGIASLVSPCPLTPAVLPTPVLSPAREGLMDMATQEWGVDGYGSMKGLIRLRANNPHHNDNDSCESDSDVDQAHQYSVQRFERRLDQDLSRLDGLETRIDDQDTLILHLEAENLVLKQRLFLMEQEMADLRCRLLQLESYGMINAMDSDEADICSEKSVAY